MPTTTTVCENCGTVIGTLETPYVHKDHVVCEECHRRLCRSSRPPRYFLIGLGCLVAAAVIVAVVVPARRPSPMAQGINSNASASPKNAAAPAIGSVTGAAWLIRSDGSSELLRGLQITILPTSVKSDMLNSCIRRDAADWAALMKLYNPEGDKDAQTATKREHFQMGTLRAEYQKRLDRPEFPEPMVATKDAIVFVAHMHQAKHDAISLILLEGEGNVAKLKLQGSSGEAMLQAIDNEYRAKLSPNLVRMNSLDFDQLVTKRIATDSDGKYSIEGLVPGRYCLHAELNQPTTFAEWAINIDVASGTPVKLDLFNDNALVVLAR